MSCERTTSRLAFSANRSDMRTVRDTDVRGTDLGSDRAVGAAFVVYGATSTASWMKPAVRSGVSEVSSLAIGSVVGSV